jgi:hypothetical protein
MCHPVRPPRHRRATTPDSTSSGEQSWPPNTRKPERCNIVDHNPGLLCSLFPWREYEGKGPAPGQCLSRTPRHWPDDTILVLLEDHREREIGVPAERPDPATHETQRGMGGNAAPLIPQAKAFTRRLSSHRTNPGRGKLGKHDLAECAVDHLRERGVARD